MDVDATWMGVDVWGWMGLAVDACGCIVDVCGCVWIVMGHVLRRVDENGSTCSVVVPSALSTYLVISFSSWWRLAGLSPMPCVTLRNDAAELVSSDSQLELDAIAVSTNLMYFDIAVLVT
jgi:hypothetical protein